MYRIVKSLSVFVFAWIIIGISCTYVDKDKDQSFRFVFMTDIHVQPELAGAEGFKQLEELANLLKGAVGSSRPPVDNGWVPESMQVGLTGKIVAPNLYLAVALSGSSQHMSGCSGSKNIVAINKDSEANIVKLSRYAVIGDWKKVIPALTTKVKELLEQ